eukprot:CAMPEP_0202946374 /NCGR_PEP_ID=MMETSP1395-20130829/9183_1 /ASSEMBLY_ACC=CAM_ASM_000871 /TAXON_ID=5961 /ORGANISM="Blepharisma japonicum, Strain Stock R1072" /LENGTH=37 /DNA_ID= /DNA_START= /DNA_END= /DNA_ORIENTATION=
MQNMKEPRDNGRKNTLKILSKFIANKFKDCARWDLMK